MVKYSTCIRMQTKVKSFLFCHFGTNLKKITKNIWFSILKGTVQRDFRSLVFFIILTGLGHRPMGENIYNFG